MYQINDQYLLLFLGDVRLLVARKSIQGQPLLELKTYFHNTIFSITIRENESILLDPLESYT